MLDHCSARDRGESFSQDPLAQLVSSGCGYVQPYNLLDILRQYDFVRGIYIAESGSYCSHRGNFLLLLLSSYRGFYKVYRWHLLNSEEKHQ